MQRYDCIIAGGGPAGLTAGIYACRAGLKTLLIESTYPGGQIVNAHMLENYPGFPQGIPGSDFGTLLEEQATRFGLEIEYDQITDFDLIGDVKRVVTASGSFEGRTVILCMGSQPKRLGIEGEERFSGRGVSFCATCDGNFFAGKDVAVIGGGDTACSDALYLARIVNKVYVVHRRDQLRAQQHLAKQVVEHPRIEVLWDTQLQCIEGEEQVQSILVQKNGHQQSEKVPVSAAFIAVGTLPMTDVLNGVLELDADGYIVTDAHMRTSIPGVYAAGDIRATVLRQVITAAADGAVAAMAAGEYI